MPKTLTNVHTKYQLFTDSEIQCGQDFNVQGHYSQIKGQITPWCCRPTLLNHCRYKYQLPTHYSLRDVAQARS